MIHQYFFLFLFQDCNDDATRKVIESYKDVTLIQQPDQRDIIIPPKDKKFKGYYKIARHYGWALNTTFHAGFDYVIIVEGTITLHIRNACNQNLICGHDEQLVTNDYVIDDHMS